MSRLASPFTLLFLFSIVNVSFQQLQMWLSGGVPVPAYVAKIGLYGLVAALWLAKPAARLDRQMRTYWTMLVLALGISFAVVRFQGELSLADQIIYLFSNYFFLLFLPLCLLVPPFLDLEKLFRILLVLLFPLALLGIAQNWSSNPIVATESNDKRLVITSWLFGGHDVRAFSLFASGLDFSYFLAVMAAFLVAYWAKNRTSLGRKLVALLGAVLVIVATNATITRLAFVFVALSAFFGYVFSRGKSLSRRQWFLLPILGMAVGFVIMVVAPLIGHRVSAEIFDAGSLVERVYHWATAIEVWRDSGVSVFLFGTGITQGASNPDYIVDNTFLNFAVQTGLFGAVTGIAFMYLVWMSFRKVINEQATPAAIAICSFWATWLLTGTFNTTNSNYCLIAMPLLLSYEFAGLSEPCEVLQAPRMKLPARLPFHGKSAAH